MEKIPVVQDIPAPEGKLHVRLTEGRFQNVRRLTSWPLLALFFTLVWIESNGEPWLLFSFEQHRILLFGNAISWRDLSLLAGLLIAAAALLFFVAVAWGRVWCGFACPQSIWTWMFIRIENITEGSAHTRARQARQPITGELASRRLVKHLLWLALALATSVTFVGYFVPIRQIITASAQFQLSADIAAWIGIIALLTYLNAGLVREKICLHACPYARFQSVMFDADTQTVSYDQSRGEPRVSRRKGDGSAGDCVDCGICQQVCPTGIDIRNGLQAACIDCGACIDGCDRVMKKLGRPPGLIRFTSESRLQGQPGRVLRPRLTGYALVMVSAFAGVIFGFTDTTELLIEIRRDRTALFRQMDRNTVCNHYQIKVEGYQKQSNSVLVTLAEPAEFTLFGPPAIDLSENSATWLPYRICATIPQPVKRTLVFRFINGDSEARKETTFLTHRF